MDITVAYFHPLFDAEKVRRDFAELRSIGATTLIFAIHEQEDNRYQRDFERGFRQAQDAGLNVVISLARFGNLFAGPSLLPGWYTFRHPQSRVQDRHGRAHGMTCYNHEAFRTWLYEEVQHYLTTYPINGILLEEPRGPEITCFCSVCRALCPDINDLQHFRRRSYMEFLTELFQCVKQTDPHAKTSLTLLPQDLILLDDLVHLPYLDTIGVHPFWQLLQEDFQKVGEWSTMLVRLTRAHRKRSQLWLQNFSLDEAGEQCLEPTFRALMQAQPDDLACYYFWRNNSHPTRVWDRTRNLFRSIPRRQLHWQTSTKSTNPLIPALDTNDILHF